MDHFCSLTSLHGWNFFAQTRKSIFHKIFWLFINIAAFIAAVALVEGIFIQFCATTIDISLETTTTPIDQLFFPSISVCNAQEIRRSVIQELTKELGDVDEELILDAAIGIVTGKDIGLTIEDQELRDKIFASNTVDDLYDDMYASFINASNSNAVASDSRVVAWHPEICDNNLNRRTSIEKTIELKTFLFPLLASQLVGELVVGANLPDVSFVDISTGVATDYSETCNWVSGFVGSLDDLENMQ